jgi:hypothetical protein
LRTELTQDLKKDTVIGQPLKIGDRTLYPVIIVSTLNTKERSFSGAWISPLAMVVVEPTQKYAVPLTDEPIDLEQILELVARASSHGGIQS